MNKILLLVICMLTLATQLDAKKIAGQIVYGNKVVDVTFFVPVMLLSSEPNYERIQWKISYLDSAGFKKVLLPDQAKEIRFTYLGEKVRMLSRRNTLSQNLFKRKHLFLKLSMDGQLKLFQFFDMNNSPGMMNPTTGHMTGSTSSIVIRSVFQIDGKSPILIRLLSFKADMLYYFEGCSALVEKIKRREFRKRDINEIVRFYNKNC